MISPSSTNPRVTQIGDMIFRVCFIDPDQGYAMAKFAYDNLKARKAAIMVDQKQAYSTGLGENVREWFTKFGGKIVSQQQYAGGSADFSAQLNNIKPTEPDVVFLTGYYNEVGSIIRQARRAGLNAPFIGGDGWESPELGNLGGDAINGNYYTNHYAPEDTRPESVKFVTEYKQQFNELPGGLTALGYDSAMLLFDAIERANSLDGKAIAKAISETKNFPGVTGSITIDKDRNAKKPLVVIEMQKGQPVYKATIDPPQ
jgi:branched-chain amino acid transport system substrate-binding protein